jgi:anti-sigma B factor antagonist
MTVLRTRTRTLAGKTKLVAVSGDLDIEGTERLRRKIDRILDGRPTRIILDLQKVKHLCSTGASLLYYYQKATSGLGVEFGILKPSPQARLVIDLIGGDRVFRIAETMEDLTAAAKGKPAAKKRRAKPARGSRGRRSQKR